MKNKLTDNLALKLASVIVAVGIWLVVVNIDDPVATRRFNGIQVQLMNEAYVEKDGKVPMLDEADDTTSVVVTGRRKQIQRLTAADVIATADLRQAVSLNTDPVMVPINVTCKGIDQDQITATPQNIAINLEQKQTQEFIVTVNSADYKTGKGYEVGVTTANPEKVRITGPASLIRRIDKVVAYVNGSSMNTDVTIPVELKVIDKNQDDFTESQMKYLKFDTSKVNVTVNLWKVKPDVSIQGAYAGVPAAGYQVSSLTMTPSAVSVTGSEEALKALAENGNVIQIPADVVDVTGHRNDFETKVDISEYLPENLRLTTDTQGNVIIKVSILPEGGQAFEIPTEKIKVENAPNGLETVFETEKVEVRVRTVSEKSMEELKESDIKVSIDLSDMVEGSYDVPLEVELPEGYELVSGVSAEVSLAKMKSVEEGENN